MKDLNKVVSQSSRLPGVVATLAAALNLAWVAYYWGNILQTTRDSIAQGGSGPLIDHSMMRMHLMIEAALIITAVGMLSRKVAGIVIAALALVWIGVQYAGWWIWTQRTIEAAGLTAIPSSIPHAANLYEATGWNVAILAIATVLFVWEIKVLAGALIGSRGSSTQ